MAGHAHHEHFDPPAPDKIWRPKPVKPFDKPITEDVEMIWPDATGPEPIVDSWEHVPIRRAFAIWFTIMGGIGLMWYVTPTDPSQKPPIKDHSKTIQLGADREVPNGDDMRIPKPLPEPAWAKRHVDH